jgi:hypothetical protein
MKTLDIFKIYCLFITFLLACAHTPISSPPPRYKEVFAGHDDKRINWLNKAIRPLMPERLASIYDHSMLKPLRSNKDCTKKFCPQIDIWQYKFIANNSILTSKSPIASKKEYWKHPKEARIIAVTLFGEKQLYYDLLLEYIESMKLASQINGFENQNWGFESFTVRIYVAKRNPKKAHIGPLKGEVPDNYIDVA